MFVIEPDRVGPLGPGRGSSPLWLPARGGRIAVGGRVDSERRHPHQRGKNGRGVMRDLGMASGSSAAMGGGRIDRRVFLAGVACSAACAGTMSESRAGDGDRAADRAPLIDTHMHVWAGDTERFPFAHPYDPKFKPPRTAGT